MSWASFVRRRSVRSLMRGGLRYLFGKRGQRRVRGLRLFYGMRMGVVLSSSEPLAKLARGEDVRIWVDGDEAFPRLEKLIRRARHSIVVQMFIWRDDTTGRRIASVLLDAADRGVNVHITKEASGDFFEFHQDFISTKGERKKPWNRFWKHPNIRVSYASQGDHAKVYVFDDQILALTGMNIGDVYRHSLHDYMVELRGKRFVEHYLARRVLDEDIATVRLVMNTEEQKQVRGVMMDLIHGAQESLVIEHCYVSDPEVIEAISDASQRGVAVTMILPERTELLHHHANMQSVGQLLSEAQNGYLRVLLYPGIFHGKILLVDHETAFLGSANLMKSSLDEMGEVNVLIRQKQRALWKLQETLRQDTLRSRSLSSPPPFLWVSRWLAWIGL